MSKTFIIVISILGILALVIAREFLVITQTRMRASDVVAASMRHTQHPETPSAKVLFLGDSLAAGVGAESPGVSVAGRLGALYPNILINNIAVSGFTIADTKDAVREDTQTYDTIVLQVGANDVFNLTPPPVVRSMIRALFAELKQRGNRVIFMSYGDVGLTPGIPPVTAWFFHHRSMELRDIFIEESEKAGIIYVDLYEGKGNDLFGSNQELYYAKDLVHPTGAGYEVWFNKLIEVYKQ